MLNKIFKRIKEFYMDDCESEAMYIEYIVEYKDSKCILHRVETYYSNEYDGGHDAIDTVDNGRVILTLDCTLNQFALILMSLVNHKREYEYEYGRRTVNSVTFVSKELREKEIKNATNN